MSKQSKSAGNIEAAKAADDKRRESIHEELEELRGSRKSALLAGDFTELRKLDAKAEGLQAELRALDERQDLLAEAQAEAEADAQLDEQAQRRKKAAALVEAGRPLVDRYEQLATELACVLKQLAAADAFIGSVNAEDTEGDLIPYLTTRRQDAQYSEQVMTWWDFPSQRRNPSEGDAGVVISDEGDKEPERPEPLKVNHRYLGRKLIFDLEEPELRRRRFSVKHGELIVSKSLTEAFLPGVSIDGPDLWTTEAKRRAEADAQALVGEMLRPAASTPKRSQRAPRVAAA